MMKVILKEDVPNLGVVGDMVTVRDGYGRNYLIPQGKAVFASVRSQHELDHQKRLAAHNREKMTAEAQGSKQKIEKLSVVMQAKVAPPPIGDDGEPVVESLPKLFGSITNRDLAKVLSDSGVKVDHRRVTLQQHVGTVGKFEARVRLNGGVHAQLPFWVIPEGSEDVETQKKRVEEAQETAAKEKEEAALREAAAASGAAAAPEEGAEEAGEASEGEAEEAEA